MREEEKIGRAREHQVFKASEISNSSQQTQFTSCVTIKMFFFRQMTDNKNLLPRTSNTGKKNIYHLKGKKTLSRTKLM